MRKIILLIGIVMILLISGCNNNYECSSDQDCKIKYGNNFRCLNPNTCYQIIEGMKGGYTFNVTLTQSKNG